MRKLAEWAARKGSWRLLRLALKRLGVPWYLWPVLWLSRKILNRVLRKRGLTVFDLLNAMKRASEERRGGESGHVGTG